MAVTTAEALSYEDGCTEAEYSAFAAAFRCAHEPAPNREEQFRDLFLVMLPERPHRVPVVAIIGLDRNGTQALDGVWVFWPGAVATYRSRGDAFKRTVLAWQEQRDAELDVMRADLEALIRTAA